MAKRKQQYQYDYNAIPDTEYFLRMRYNAPDNANVFGIGGGAGTFTETTQETNPALYQQQVNTQNQNNFLNTMSENSNAMAGVMGGINNAITVLQDPNASNAQKVFGALGIGAAAKIWEGDTSKVDNTIKDAQAQMQTGKHNLIQDASSVSGAMQGLKANSLMPRQRINFTPTYYNNWEELKGGKGGFWKNMGTAALQGAANGSIGGPWGAAGGAIAGILGSVAGLIGRKDRYKKAMRKANERMNYMVNAARGFNMEQDFAEKAANQNLISNGINTQRTLDMANFRAYGGGIDLSPNLMAMQQQKQDNDRLKALNQPFSLGLGNSFNQKMNMFPNGGPIDPPKESEVPSTTAVMNTTDSLYVDNTLSPAQKAVLGGVTPTDYALAVTKEALDAERAKAKQNTQTVINMLYGDKHGEADNSNRYDFGGTMKNLPSEMQSYETGGTHEQNPYGGIQIGVDGQGNPNLVEQGEFRYGDYIFSDRIPVDYDTLFDFGLIASVPKKKPKKGQEKTYADYAKDLVNKTGDPNDPITKRTNDANLQRLANAEEYQKAAEQGQLALDDSLNEYKSALKNGQSPMYGSMKYNGMNGGADPMDASSLTNVSRSGTPMMAAYGGNLFAAGGSPYDNPFAVNRYNIAKNYPQNTLADLIPAPRLLPDPEDPNYIDPYSRDYDGTVTDADWLKRAQGFSQYNDLVTGYYDPDEIAALRGSYGLNRSGGADKDFIMALQTDLKNKGYYKGRIDGDFGPKSAAALDAMNGTWTWTPYNANTQVPTNTQFNGVLSKYNSYSTSNGRFAGNDAAQTNVENMTNIHTTDPNSSQAPVENTGEIQPQTGQMADTTRWQFKKLPTQGKWATLGLNAVQAGADANGFTNPDFTPNFNDANRLERKGEASTFARTNAHIGGYQAPDITDIQSPLAQAAQQQQATNRALQNMGGNRASRMASIVANDYNAGQTMGDIVTKANAQNAANRMAAAEINRGIDQFNAQADNDMYKDNLGAQISGQQMNLNATQASNENRLRQMLYQDATNRQAHQNIVTNQNQMYNNVLNMIADQAARNEEWNLINSKHNQDFYFDPKTGGWEYKGDSGAYSRLNNALATIYPDMPMTGLSADVQKEWNNLLQSKGGQNITNDEIRWIVDMERNAQIEQKAKREHELKLAELNKDNTTAKANGGYISNKKKSRYTNYDYNAI